MTRPSASRPNVKKTSVLSPRAIANFGTRWFRQTHQRDRRTVLTQIAAIVSTNAALPEGLYKCSLDAPNPRVGYILGSLSECTESGISLADAIQGLGSWFRPHYIAQIRAGERTGRLAEALKSLTVTVNAELQDGRVFRNHIAYFTAILLFEILLLLFLGAKVFPVFYEIIEEFGSRPPVFVRIVAASSQFVEDYGSVLIFVPLLFALLYAIFRLEYHFSTLFQSACARCLLHTPFVGAYFRDTQIQRLSRALALRLAGDQPLPEALSETAAEGLTVPYEKMLERVARDIEHGTPLSVALALQRRLVGTQLPELVRLGEAREDLAWAFHEAAELHARSTRRTRRIWAEALVPVGVGICSVFVIIVAAATFTAFSTIADSIGTEL